MRRWSAEDSSWAVSVGNHGPQSGSGPGMRHSQAFLGFMNSPSSLFTFPESSSSSSLLLLRIDPRLLHPHRWSFITMLFSRGGQQQQQGQPPPPSQSWYPPSIPGPSRVPPPPPPNFGAHPFGINPFARHSDARPSSGTVYPPSTSAGSYSGGVYPPPTASSSGPYSQNPPPSNSVASLNEKSPEELTSLLNDKDAYNAFLHSRDEVRRLDKFSDDLRKSTLDESRNNLAKESEIAELRTQCMIIRNTELAASQEKFEELEKRYKEVQDSCSPQALINELEDAANKADEESENLHRSFLAGEIELLEFIQKYRKYRLLYHRRSLIRMAALSSITPG